MLSTHDRWHHHPSTLTFWLQSSQSSRTCVKNLVLQNFCACPSAKSAFAKSLFPSGETSLKCHHPVPIRNLQFLLSKSSSLSLSFCYGWMMLISSFSMSRYCEDSDEGYFCQALLRIKAFWLCVRQRLPIRFISQEKIVLQFSLSCKIVHVFGNTDISLIFWRDLYFALFCSIFLST